MSTSTLPLFLDDPIAANFGAATDIRSARSGSFTDNMKLPIHRWLRYSAGFSAAWAESAIRDHAPAGLTVLDPFAGSGTTVLAAQTVGAVGIGFDSHPFVARIAQAKLLWPRVSPSALMEAARVLISRAKTHECALPGDLSPLLRKCYTNDALTRLFSLRDALRLFPPDDSATRELVWLAITAILRPCSYVGTAQWQYVLPNKRKARTADPYLALASKVGDMAADIDQVRAAGAATSGSVLAHDAREAGVLANDSVDLVLTSPPYPNNYDYADATRLEMTFWGEIDGWADLQHAVRRHIVRSCSQHTAAERLELDRLLSSEHVRSIASDLASTCNELGNIRLEKGGKKTYHTMVAAYFADLSRVFRALRKVCKTKSRVCFVVGDSAPYGVYVPTDEWLGALALDAGFRKYTFEKLRDRNIKWKNRKHRVPLKEGRLWIDG